MSDSEAVPAAPVASHPDLPQMKLAARMQVGAVRRGHIRAITIT